jgi:hypothetical protein
MLDTASLIKKINILILMGAVVSTGSVACGEPVADKTSEAAYRLTHTAADAEYILNWDLIVSRCPDIGKYDKQEDFVRRGETKQSGTGGTSTLDMESLAAWASIRSVQTAPAEEKVRGFGIMIMYCETDEYLDEYVGLIQMTGFPVQEEGEFVTGVMEAKDSPMKSAQLVLAGKRFVILFMESASSDESLFFSKDELTELLPAVKSNISSLEITPLPPDIPAREKAEEVSSGWHEFMTFRSDELTPPVQVSEGQHYNDLIFSARPLMQIFNFTIDKDWRFVMTAEGIADTRFEVYITVTSPGQGGLSYSTDHVFTLHSAPITIIREEPLENKYTPPVNVEIRIFFDRPMDWVMEIEK